MSRYRTWQIIILIVNIVISNNLSWMQTIIGPMPPSHGVMRPRYHQSTYEKYSHEIFTMEYPAVTKVIIIIGRAQEVR